MSPWIAPQESSALEGEALLGHYQVILRRIRKWVITQPESPALTEFWNELRDAERPLYRPGNSIDVVSINAVIDTATKLGFSSEN